jgi:hypothetical protein
VGEKDENISPDQARKIVGDKYAERVEAIALSVYKAASEYAVSIHPFTSFHSLVFRPIESKFSFTMKCLNTR